MGRAVRLRVPRSARRFQLTQGMQRPSLAGWDGSVASRKACRKGVGLHWRRTNLTPSVGQKSRRFLPRRRIPHRAQCCWRAQAGMLFFSFFWGWALVFILARLRWGPRAAPSLVPYTKKRMRKRKYCALQDTPHPAQPLEAEAPMPTVHNIVATAQITSTIPMLDLNKIHEMLPFSFYDQNKFAAITVRLHDPDCTTLLFSSGKLVVTGCRCWPYVLSL